MKSEAWSFGVGNSEKYYDEKEAMRGLFKSFIPSYLDMALLSAVL